MKILHVIANLAPRYGGPAKAGLEMSSALARLGHDVTIFTTNQDGAGVLDVPVNKPVVQDGVTIRYFPVQFPKFWRTSSSMAKALREEMRQYDIVHIHSIYLFHGMVAGHYARKYKIPYIIRPHGTLDPVMYARHRYRKKVMELLFENRNIRKADALHYTTEEEMILARPYVFDSPGFVVPNGLNSADYSQLPAEGTFRSTIKGLGTKKMILFLGRVNFKKGLDILVQSFRIVHRQHPDSMLIIAGPDDDNYAKKVQGWIDEAGLTEHVKFIGMVTGEAKHAVLRDADMFVLPSYSENFGISVIEAMACGIPVVISDKVNIWREIVANEAGLAAPCDPEAFAGQMSALLSDPERLTRTGEKAEQMVKDYYEWDSISRLLDQQYRHILKDNVSAAGTPWMGVTDV
ncbi:glycosyltransferase [Paenibacillus sp. JX-17]|uniref:Glycosyltransferase n=1 Tax=Paenibacillus lacisoli TaxID=3064525 RepID=A0ABT9CD56_9BACL|nr:glycosyltransferase [Paenibacillus sp. JX-17]MDO7907205.1 glycosyltransferase [Paenibacillus sp. JX-17]